MCCNNNNNKLKGVRVIGAGGLVVSVIAFAVGAILDWAVTEPYQHGFNINKVGWILMVVGAIGAVLSIIVMVAGNTRRRQTVVDDGQGNVVRRVDSTYLGRSFVFGLRSELSSSNLPRITEGFGNL